MVPGADLRASAGPVASGETVIDRVYRGYEGIVEKLQGIDWAIERVRVQPCLAGPALSKCV